MTDMLGQFRFQRELKDVLRELAEQVARPDQFHALFSSRHELLAFW